MFNTRTINKRSKPNKSFDLRSNFCIPSQECFLLSVAKRKDNARGRIFISRPRVCDSRVDDSSLLPPCHTLSQLEKYDILLSRFPKVCAQSSSPLASTISLSLNNWQGDAMANTKVETARVLTHVRNKGSGPSTNMNARRVLALSGISHFCPPTLEFPNEDALVSLSQSNEFCSPKNFSKIILSKVHRVYRIFCLNCLASESEKI